VNVHNIADGKIDHQKIQANLPSRTFHRGIADLLEQAADQYVYDPADRKTHYQEIQANGLGKPVRYVH